MDLSTANVASAGISAGSGLLGGLIGLIGQSAQFRQQKKLINQQYQLQSKLNQESYLQNLEQWNRENVYNSPTQQMARLAEAGLNPNLIYGSTDGGSAARSPQVEPAQVGVANAPNYADSYVAAVQSATAGAHLAQSFAQADYTKALTQKTLAEAQRLGHFNTYADELYSSQAGVSQYKQLQEKERLTMFQQQVGMNETKAQMMLKELDNKFLDYEIKRTNYDMLVDTYDYQLEMVKTAAARLVVALINDEKHGRLTEAQISATLANYRNTTAIAVQNENNPNGFTGESGNIARAARSGLDWAISFLSEDNQKRVKNFLHL